MLTTVADGYAPIGLKDAFVPFLSPYRPVWLGLGAVAFDLLLALVLTSYLRSRLGVRVWRLTHWLAYAAWPVALLHAAGTGSDARSGWLSILAAASLLAVAAAILVRVGRARGSVRLRAGAGVAALVVPLALVVWYRSGPARPGWAARAGTPKPLIASRRLASSVSPPVAARRSSPPRSFASTASGRSDAARRTTARCASRSRSGCMTRRAARCASTFAAARATRASPPRQRPLVRPGDDARGLLRERHRSRRQRGRRDRAGSGGRHARASRGPDTRRGCGHRDGSRRGQRGRRQMTAAARERVAPPPGRARLLAGTDSRRGLAGHLATFGSLVAPDDLVELVEAAGLKGRGGAAFPTAAKLAVVAARRGAVVVANGAEGEPASRKDRALLRVAPHLVLDGAALAAGAVGARTAVLAVSTGMPGAGGGASRERQAARRDRVAFELAIVPDAFVAGEETALLRHSTARRPSRRSSRRTRSSAASADARRSSRTSRRSRTLR